MHAGESGDLNGGAGGRPPTRVLIVEDNPTYAAIVQGLLAEASTDAFEGEVCGRLGDALHVAAGGTIDLVLLDLTLPDSDGLDTFRNMQEAATDVPIVVLTGLDDESVGTTAVSLGAQDYLVKGKTDRHLVQSMRYALERHRLVREVAHAREEAERASQAKSEFLSRMSHELRTPLNAILGFGQLLAIDETDEDRRDYARRILRAGAHLTELIDELLDISRIESGTLVLRIEPVHLRDVVADSVALVEPLAMRRGVTVDTDRAMGRHWVDADAQRLRQILVNLLSNAVKYNRAGGRVVVSASSSGNSKVQVTVTDEGQGIAPELLDRLFEPFDRLGAETSGIEGTGLGLALARGLARAMKGTIGARSTLGGGSTFWVELHAADAPVSSDLQGSAAHAGGQEAAGDRTVLCIEDDPSNLLLVERILAHRPGLRFLGASDGRRGLELATKARPSLIVLDLHLPDMDGADLLRRLREHEDTASIPVVVLTADTRPGIVRDLIAAGAADHLMKPIDVQAFLVAVDRTLTREG